MDQIFFSNTTAIPPTSTNTSPTTATISSNPWVD